MLKTQIYSTVSSLAAIALLAVCPAASRAANIELGINGDAQIGLNYIDFGQYPNGAPYTPAPGYGTFEVSLVNSGIFSNAGVTTGEFGTIQSLNEGPGNVALPSAFLTFDTGGSNLQLWATKIPAGTVGPFVPTATSIGAVLSFDVEGKILDSSNPDLNQNFTATFAATFPGSSVADLFNSLPVNTPFSATLTETAPVTATPEPGSWLLVGAGLFAVGTIARRRRRSSSTRITL